MNPLWTFEDYEFPWSVEVAPDGIHMVTFPVFSEHEIRFFANGTLLRGYSIEQLVDFPSVWRRSLLGQHEWFESCWFDESRPMFWVTTNERGRLGFDLRTGEIVSNERPLVRFLALGIVAVGLAVAGMIGWRLWKRTRPHESDD